MTDRAVPLVLRSALALLAGLLPALAVPAPAPAASAALPGLDVARAQRVAQAAGCFACHQVDPRPAPDEDDDEVEEDPTAARPPIAPAWRHVATQYRHRSGALERLTRTVMGGSNPYEPHWKYEVSGLAMPPNRIAISEDDARLVVRWILSLDDAN